MRRNRISHGGGGGNFSSGGPFLTDHLKDIDLELDLLKRKREMLEQQQQQFIQPLMQQNNFNQLPYYVLEPKQSGSNRDFSHLYNDGYQQHSEPFSRKRQSVNDWHHDSYPKRFADQGRRSPSSAGPSPARYQRPHISQNQQTKPTYSTFTPFKYEQAKQFIGRKINKQKQHRPSQNFVANKVTKATKAFVPPNKIASHPVVDRNKLVAAAVKSVAGDREALRLLPEKEPTKQITGRLELALGTILREIRDTFGESSQYELLRFATLQRVIKQNIRRRIRSAMLGKVVGATQAIVKEYRAMYPKDTDLEIVNIALEAGGTKPEKNPKPIVLEKAEKDRPEEYFKTSMIKIIERHLHEMFDKLEEIYNPPLAPEKDGAFSKGVTAKDRNMETNNKEKEKVDKIAQETEVAAKKENVTVSNGEVNVSANIEVANGDAANNESVAAANTKNIANANHGDEASFNVEELLPANEYKKVLPRLLKRHIPTILKLLNLKKMYRQEVDDIINSTRAKFVEGGETSEVSQTPKKIPYVVLPYYVKVMGKPHLPKRNIMNTFLEEFNPKSIKKHRTIHNLLFIGLKEKSDFDAIVQADGTVIGRSTLSIRVCNKSTRKSDNNNSTSSVNIDQNAIQNQDVLNESATDSDFLGTELDGQITDLLTSIRNSEEDTLNDNSKSDIQEEEKPMECIEENANYDKAGLDNVGVLENNREPINGNEQNEITHDTENTHDPKNTHDPENKDEVKEASEKNDQLAELKNIEGRATPTRASTRLANTSATPSSIRTRRASRLMQN